MSRRHRKQKGSSRKLLDTLEKMFPESDRKELYARVLCGEVQVDGATERNPAQPVRVDADIAWTGTTPVGRGAHKIEAALDAFHVSCGGKTIIDAGSSTGGFTEKLLERGAASVYAVDSGFNQLAWKLRTDSRVHVMESLNVLDLTSAMLATAPDFAVCDLSFRSLQGAARHIADLCLEGRVIALAKPQFEMQPLGFERDGSARPFDGVVADDEGEQIVDSLIRTLGHEGLRCKGRVASPIRGRRGNREFLLDLVKDPAPAPE